MAEQTGSDFLAPRTDGTVNKSSEYFHQYLVRGVDHSVSGGTVIYLGLVIHVDCFAWSTGAHGTSWYSWISISTESERIDDSPKLECYHQLWVVVVAKGGLEVDLV